MYEEIEEDERLLDEMQRLQSKMQSCRDEVLCCRLRLVEDAGPHNRRKLAEAKAALARVENEYRELLDLD